MLLWIPAALAWNELRTNSVDASSFLQSNWNKYEENYHPRYAFDDDPKTGWVEGVEGDGVGQWIAWDVSRLASARAAKLQIWNGYQKSGSLLAANAAPKEVEITLSDMTGRVVGTHTATLQRQMGAQEVEVATTAGFSTVRLTVKSVWPGKTYKDSVISDIRLYVDSDVAYNAEVEAGRLASLQAWIKQRKDTAAYFAKLPAAYPFRTAQGTNTDLGTVDRALCLNAASDLAAALTELRADTRWYQARRPAAPPTPDALWSSPGLDWMDANAIKFLETTKDTDTHTKGDASEGNDELWVGNTHVIWADTARTHPKYVWTWVRHAGEEREVYDYKEEWVYAYDDAGHLITAYQPPMDTPFMEPDAMTHYALSWDAGKIYRVVRTMGPGTTSAPVECESVEARF